MIAVRKANLGDTEIVAQMLCDAYQIIFPDFAEHDLEKYREVTPQFIQGHVNDLYVAVDNTVVMGYMLGQLSNGICLTKPIYTIQQLYILDEYRGSRAALMLFKFAEQLVEKHKAVLNIVTNSNDIITRAIETLDYRVEGTIIRVLK